jgi:peptide-methionine (S)-S-oxide reductase
MRISSGVLLGSLVFGCAIANAGEHQAAAGAAAKNGAETPARVGTDPGGVGQGTPLTAKPGHELAAFAAGCFWGVEDAFRRVSGVTATAVGYTGGHTKDPTYPKVCEHDTGHAETVLVEFDPKKVSYERLLGIFFEIHDPTTLNRQGPDFGDQYRSSVFTFSQKQEVAARSALVRTEAKIAKRVVSQIVPIGPFYKAEDYHQQYAERTGSHGCPIRSFSGSI